MSISAPLPSFDRAEFHGDPPLADRCAYCHRNIETEYFRVDGNMACPACAQQAQSLIPPDSHKAYSRAVMFGIGAAIVGCTGYALVTILTGWTIGYAAIAVGYLVGKAMKSGSRGLGGRRYQITAAVLTYTAVALAFVPLALHLAYKDSAEKRDAAQHAVSAPVENPSASSVPADGKGAVVLQIPSDGSGQKAVAVTPTPEPAAPPAKPANGLGGFLVAVVTLLGIGLVSPFLELASSPLSGLIGIFIVFIGISTAWRLTQRVASDVEGPFEHGPTR